MNYNADLSTSHTYATSGVYNAAFDGAYSVNYNKSVFQPTYFSKYVALYRDNKVKAAVDELSALPLECQLGKVKLAIPDSISSLDASLLSNVKRLQNLYFGHSSKLKRIESRAFAWQQDLREVVLPPSLVYIAPSAFIGCCRLTAAYVPEGTKYESAFVGCPMFNVFEYGGNSIYDDADALSCRYINMDDSEYLKNFYAALELAPDDLTAFDGNVVKFARNYDAYKIHSVYSNSYFSWISRVNVLCCSYAIDKMSLEDLEKMAELEDTQISRDEAESLVFSQIKDSSLDEADADVAADSSEEIEEKAEEYKAALDGSSQAFTTSIKKTFYYPGGDIDIVYDVVFKPEYKDLSSAEDEVMSCTAECMIPFYYQAIDKDDPYSSERIITTSAAYATSTKYFSSAQNAYEDAYSNALAKIQMISAQNQILIDDEDTEEV